jgi:uncharacterized protein (DUF58 family)
MTLLPSGRLLRWAAALAAASLLVLVVPWAWLPLLAADLLLAAVALLDLLLTPGPAALEVTRLAADRLSVLQESPVVLHVRNHSGAALWVRVRDTVPESFHTLTEELGGQAPAGGETRLEYTVVPRTRGRHTWGAIHLRYESLLGLWLRGARLPAEGATDVSPALASLERYHLLARSNRLDVLGIRQVRWRGGSSEFESLRDYAFGDDVRQLDWKATARRGKLIVRNEQAERNQTVLLLVDCGRLMNVEVGGQSKLDHAVTTALILSHVALSRGDRVGLCTFSHQVHDWLAPRGHLSQNRLITQALYDLKGDFTESDHARCLKLVAGRHPKRSLLVVLTDFVDATTAADMIAHLRLASRRHLVLFAALKDPFLEQAARRDPLTSLEGFRKAAAVDLLHERREVLEGIRQMGGHVIDAEPAGVTPPVINGYLEIMLRGLL